MIERHGCRIVLRREDETEGADRPRPDYAALIRPVADVGAADRWSWEWTEEGELRPADDTSG